MRPRPFFLPAVAGGNADKKDSRTKPLSHKESERTLRAEGAVNI
jgi:hypothetical protein